MTELEEEMIAKGTHPMCPNNGPKEDTTAAPQGPDEDDDVEDPKGKAIFHSDPGDEMEPSAK